MSKKKILKQIESLLGDSEQISFHEEVELPFEIGEAYFIRTVTYFATGRVKDIVGRFLVLEDCAWIADTGRFSDAMVNGIMDEVEPIGGDMFVNTNSITDAFPWSHDLPLKQK